MNQKVNVAKSLNEIKEKQENHIHLSVANMIQASIKENIRQSSIAGRGSL
jgi:hypothetical protein